MGWNGTIEDLSNAEIGLFKICFNKKNHIVYQRERTDASVSDSNESDGNY
jgi:hypothetical protein